MLQNCLLHVIVDLVIVAGLAQDVRAFLPEDVEERPLPCGGCIKRTLNGNDILRIVLLIVREDHQLCDVQERPERLVAEARVDAFALCQHTVVIVRLLNLDECERQAVHKTSDVRSEIVVRVWVFTRELSGAMPEVVFGVVEIDESNAA